MKKYFFNLSALFHKNTEPKTILITVFAQLIFGFFIMPLIYQTIDPTKKSILLDTRFGYDAGKAWQLLNSLGQSGRNIYLFSELFLDVLYAIIYSLAFCLLLSLFFQNSYSKKHYFQYFNVFPLVIGVADIIENVLISILIINFPQKMNFVTNISSMVGLFKWGCVVFNLLLLFIGLSAWFLTSLIRKKT